MVTNMTSVHDEVQGGAGESDPAPEWDEHAFAAACMRWEADYQRSKGRDPSGVIYTGD